MEVIQQQSFLSGCQECQQEQSAMTSTERAALLLSTSVTSYISLLLTESQRLSMLLHQMDRTLDDLMQSNQESELENVEEESVASEKSHRFQNGHQPTETKSHEASAIVSEDPSVDADIDELARSLINLLQKENEKQYVRKRDHDIPFPFFGY